MTTKQSDTLIWFFNALSGNGRAEEDELEWMFVQLEELYPNTEVSSCCVCQKFVRH